MRSNRLHIISFDIPYPANYGGAIDVYYKLEALHQAGVEVTLHCTYKGTLVHYPQLERLCEKVYYYPRKTGVLSLLSKEPYGIVSRRNDQLLINLMTDDAPILFEGLVSCGLIADPALEERKKIFRECNIEHDYLRALGKASRSWSKKLFYYSEAWKQERYEAVIAHASSIAAVAHQDEQHFRDLFPQVPTYYIPSFHAGKTVKALTGQGQYILYHGNLELAENENAALFLLREVIPALPEVRFIFAGRNPSALLRSTIETLPNASLEASPDEARMQELVRDAQIHLLPTFQGTGLKLKLLNVLYDGRWVVVNPQMVHGTDVAPLCTIAPNAAEMVNTCRTLMKKPFTENDIRERQTLLGQIYNNDSNLQTLLQLL